MQGSISRQATCGQTCLQSHAAKPAFKGLSAREQNQHQCKVKVLLKQDSGKVLSAAFCSSKKARERRHSCCCGSAAEALPTTADQDAQLWQNTCAGQLPFQQMYEQVLSPLWEVRSQLQSSWRRPKAQVLRSPGAGKAIWACQAGSAAWSAASCTHLTHQEQS